eukprot:GILI01004266.1.p1 GENE.GILI01004266.1~~GILI01004266.1.p1  ORF type:complete len:815 (+),score=74.04 GILI01004266.1:233-2677(+)
MAKTLSQNCRSCVDDALEEVAGQQDDDDIEIIDAEEEPGLDYIRHDPSVQRDLSLDEFLNEHIEMAPELPDSIDAEPPDVIPPPAIRHPSYKLNFFDSHIYEDFLRTGELPPCPDGVGQRGDRGAPAGAKNIDGEPARNFRHDISWYRKIRVIHRYQELRRMIASNKFVPEKPPIQNAQSHFIMAYLRVWQGATSDRSMRSFGLDCIAQIEKWEVAYLGKGFFYCADKCRICPRKPTNEHIEFVLAEWFRDMRENNRRVSRTSLRMKADELYRASHMAWKELHPDKDPPIATTASEGFIHNFLQRKEVVLKSVKRMTTLTDDQKSEKATKFYAHVHKYLQHTDAIANFDEIPISIGGAMGKAKTLTYSSDTLVQVNYDSNDTKRIGTLVPVVVAKKERQADGSILWEGFVLATFLIFIGEPVQDRVTSEKYFPGVDVVWSKCGVMTSHLMKTQIIPKIRKKLTERGVDSCLMVLDSAKSHTSEEIVENFWAERMPVAVVPSGMTSFLQWIDVHFAKDYRVHHTTRYEKFEGMKKTASQKRRLLSVLIGQSIASLATNERIIKTFILIGYLDATVMPKTVKDIEYPPEQTATQITETGRIINEYMETSRVAKKNRAEKAAALPATQPLLTPNPTAPAASKRGKKPVPPISGQRSLTNWMTLKITSASQPIEPNHVPLSVPVTPSPTPVPGTQQSSEVYDPCEISIVFKELGCSAKEIEEVVQASVVSQMSLAVIGSRTPEGPSQSDSEMKWMIASAMADDDSSSGFEMPQAFKDCGYRYSEPEEGEDAHNCVWSQPLYTTQGTMIVNKKKRSCKI